MRSYQCEGLRASDSRRKDLTTWCGRRPDVTGIGGRWVRHFGGAGRRPQQGIRDGLPPFTHARQGGEKGLLIRLLFKIIEKVHRERERHFKCAHLAANPTALQEREEPLEMLLMFPMAEALLQDLEGA